MFCFFFFLLFQNETYREDFLNERKEKERILSLKDKLKRDLDGAQSRISSLQEQVGPVIFLFSLVSFNPRADYARLEMSIMIADFKIQTSRGGALPCHPRSIQHTVLS